MIRASSIEGRAALIAPLIAVANNCPSVSHCPKPVSFRARVVSRVRATKTPKRNHALRLRSTNGSATVMHSPHQECWSADSAMDESLTTDGPIAHVINQRPGEGSITMIMKSARIQAAGEVPMRTYATPTHDDLAQMLGFLDASMERADWIRVLAGAKCEFGDAAFEICRQWSAESDKFNEKEFAATWRSLRNRGVTFKTVAWLAMQAGYRSGSRGTVKSIKSYAPPPHDTCGLSNHGLNAGNDAGGLHRPRDNAAGQVDPKLIQRIWSGTRTIDLDCPARLYLTGRGCRIPPSDSDVRFHPELRLYGFTGPAMVGRISLARDYRETIGLHLTWLICSEGKWERQNRRYLGRKQGGVVRLWPDECVTNGLGIAEGIETALSAANVFAPVWAALDAGNLACFPVIEGIEVLTVFADNDASGVGERAGGDCGKRWLDAGRAVRVLMPKQVGADMCDLDMEAA